MKYLKLLSCALVSVTASACSKDGSSSTNVTKPPPLTSTTARILYDGQNLKIDRRCPSETPTKVYVIRIGKGGLDIHNPKRASVYKKADGANEDDTDGTAANEPKSASIKSRSRFDIRIKGDLENSTDVVMIKIKLMDTSLKFPDAQGDPGVNSIFTNTYGQSLFCEMSPVQSEKHGKDPHDQQFRQFIVFYAKPSALGYGTAGLNIRVIATEGSTGYTLPIIIDPSVENEG